MTYSFCFVEHVRLTRLRMIFLRLTRLAFTSRLKNFVISACELQRVRGGYGMAACGCLLTIIIIVKLTF